MRARLRCSAAVFQGNNMQHRGSLWLKGPALGCWSTLAFYSSEPYMSSGLHTVKRVCCRPSSERMRSTLLPADSCIHVPVALRRAPPPSRPTTAAACAP